MESKLRWLQQGKEAWRRSSNWRSAHKVWAQGDHQKELISIKESRASRRSTHHITRTHHLKKKEISKPIPPFKKRNQHLKHSWEAHTLYNNHPKKARRALNHQRNQGNKAISLSWKRNIAIFEEGIYHQGSNLHQGGILNYLHQEGIFICKHQRSSERHHHQTRHQVEDIIIKNRLHLTSKYSIFLCPNPQIKWLHYARIIINWLGPQTTLHGRR